jgi:two-component system, chemotaxis family, protein-glutamate methylesterase/glutaminase
MVGRSCRALPGGVRWEVVSEGTGAGSAAPARIVGIGASAGGVDALIKLVSPLPADLPHAICIVLHVAPAGRSLLAGILGRHTPLPVSTAEGGEHLAPGRIFVAPPDRHLLVRDGHVVLTRGPKENGVRPAVDATLRSLAAASGPAAVAVILSGALGDGANGALAVRQAGGTVIVQEPADAIVPSMPERALAAVGEAHHVLPAAAIAQALAELDDRPAGMREDEAMAAPEDMLEASRHRPEGSATGFTCPECSGAIWEVREGEMVRYRCRIGHAFSEDAMLVEQGSAVEAARWTALEALEERAELLRRIAVGRAARHPRLKARLEAGAEDAVGRAELIRQALAIGDDGPGAFDLEDAGAAGSPA